jgi:hypothetical protein
MPASVLQLLAMPPPRGALISLFHQKDRLLSLRLAQCRVNSGAMPPADLGGIQKML